MIETWPTRQIPTPAARDSGIPWPYYMGAGGRGAQQLGATMESIAQDLINDDLKNRVSEELNELDIDLTKGWGDYQAWMQTNPDTPDTDGSKFKEHVEQWRTDYLGKVGTGIGQRLANQQFGSFVAKAEKQAQLAALQQDRTNALASFKARLDIMENVPDMPFIDPLDDAISRTDSLVNAYDTAAATGLIPGDKDPRYWVGLRESFRKVWISAVTNAMKNSPDQVEAMLSSPDSALDPEDQKRLRTTWKAQQDHQRSTEEKAKADQIKANDRNITALTLKTARGAAEPGQAITPADIEQAMLRGEVSEETGRMMWDRLLRTEEPTPEAQKKAAGVMQRTRDRLLAGRIDEGYYKKVYDAYEKDMTVAQAEKWLAVDLEDDYKDLRGEAFKLATNAIKPLFPDDQEGAEAGPDSPALKRDGPVGEIMDRIDSYLEDQKKLGKPIDRKAFREKANSVAAEIYKREYEQQNPPKRSRWTGNVAGEPTATELRQQNTREAYEKGKQLGYWK